MYDEWESDLEPSFEVPSLGIRSLDYLNLMENKCGVLWALDVHEVDTSWKKLKELDKFMKKGLVDTCTNMHGKIYFDPRYCKPLKYLSTSDLKVLLSKKSELELCLWYGHLFDELCSNLLQAGNKLKAANLILKVTERAYYYKYHSDYTLSRNLAKILKILEDRKYSFENLTYAKIVVDFLKLFCTREATVRELFRYTDLNWTTLIQSARLERFGLFGLWGHENENISLQLTHIGLFYHPYNLKAAHAMLLYAGVNKYTKESYQFMKSRFMFFISILLTSEEFEEFSENLDNIVMGKRIQYRCFQTFLLDNRIFQNNLVFQLFWNTISDPFLIHNDFEVIAAIIPKEYVKRAMLEVWNRYSSYFNVSHNCLRKPRLLQHLAIATIRETLGKSFNYPDGIKDLCLPYKLQEYVRLQDLNSMAS